LLKLIFRDSAIPRIFITSFCKSSDFAATKKTLTYEYCNSTTFFLLMTMPMIVFFFFKPWKRLPVFIFSKTVYDGRTDDFSFSKCPDNLPDTYFLDLNMPRKAALNV
jgi:hypothetical protein